MVFAGAMKIERTDCVKALAADRAISRLTPLHRPRNGIGDTILIETYVDAVSARSDAEAVFGFVTHNTKDFSAQGDDTRLPHPDLAPIFDGVTSRYETTLSSLINEFAENLIDEIQLERDFSEEPRRRAELLEAHHILDRQVWYNRPWNLRISIERGKHKLVSREEWEKAHPQAKEQNDN